MRTLPLRATTAISAHGHRGLGTKFFTYGANEANRGGQFIQDFLSASNRTAGEHHGNYLEMQTGRVPSQMHTFVLPGHSKSSWTEWFRAGTIPKPIVHDSNYSVALGALDDWIEQSVPQTTFDDTSAFLTSLESQSVDQADVLAHGLPWGGLQQLLLGEQLAPGQRYTVDLSAFAPEHGREAQPWLELLRDGTFGTETLTSLPTSFARRTRHGWRLQGKPGEAWLDMAARLAPRNCCRRGGRQAERSCGVCCELEAKVLADSCA